MNSPSPTKAVLFDLGGVIVKFREDRYFADLLRTISNRPEEHPWDKCPAVPAYESGDCTREEFGSGVIDHFDLDISLDGFIEAFREWPDGFFDGADELTQSLHEELEVGCLSNTSELHWHHQKQHKRLHQLFKHAFLSFELGVMKPDVRIYEKVTEQLGLSANEIMFFDDNPVNIESARSFGIDAHLVFGPDKARDILQERALLK